MRFTPQRRHVSALVALAAVALAVVVAVSVAWMTGSDSSTRGTDVAALAPTATTVDPRGAVTDADVNPWAFNDPSTVLRFLAERCPDVRVPAPGTGSELFGALEACVASTAQGAPQDQARNELTSLLPSGR